VSATVEGKRGRLFPTVEPLPVSVVIPAYNREDMVGRAVASALGQRPRPPAEVVVVDDCSTDGTAEAAATAGARVVRHDHNRGEGAARNTGIAHATQPWIGLLDSDDEWLPHLLATLWPLRAGHVLVGGACLSCGPDPAKDRYGGALGRRPMVLRSPASVIYPENFVAASGTMVRRDVVHEVGGYPHLKRGADMDLWIRVLERGSGLIVPRVVVIYHVHPGQITRDGEMMAHGHRTVARAYAGRSWWSRAALERWEGAAAYDAARRRWSGGHRMRSLLLLAGLLGRPTRLLGATGIVVRRARLGRRSGMVDRGGASTVALLPGAPGSGDGALDLRDVATARALVRLAARPTHRVVAASPVQALGARLVGVHEVTRTDGGAGVRESTP
jgi:glycosyltransferase involved in cell wall biosynthesis